jgi:hypothetical protein
VCHLVTATYLIRYNASSFSTPPGQAAANTLSSAINGGWLRCFLAELHPNTVITIRSGSVCPKTSIPPALRPTQAPASALTTAITTNEFVISNTAGITEAALNTNGNKQRVELSAAYKSLLDKNIADIVAKGAVLQYDSNNLNVTTIACPTGFPGLCHMVRVGFTLLSDPKVFVGTPPGTTATFRMQAAISAGSLICEHERLSPSALVEVRSGNACPTTPTAAPVVITPSPTTPGITTATLNLNFRILNAGSVTTAMLQDPTNSAATQLLAAFTALMNKRMATFTASAPLRYGSTKLGAINSVACPSSAAAGSICHAVAASFQLNYTANLFTTPPGAGAGQAVQDAINAGDLDCILETFSTVLQVTTGGGCAATNPPTFDSSTQVSNRFFISNQRGITASVLQSTNNAQATELAKAYNSLIADTLKAFFVNGAVMDGVATIDVFTPESQCPTGSTCQVVTGNFKLKYNRSSFPNGGVGQMALDVVQAAINAGSMICYHDLLSPNSIVKVISGTTCPAPVSIPGRTNAPATAVVNPVPAAAPAEKCPVPFVWKRPSWWKKYRLSLTRKVLKKCIFFAGKVPAPGKTCLPAQEGFVCMFGEAKCNAKVEPETKCQCTNGVWVCSTVCSTPKCPVAMPSGTCDPLVNVIKCEYNEHCCGDTCQMTGFCSCVTNNGKSDWLCAVADVLPCNQISLKQAGCPCDRPVNGGACTGDYGCGDACCGKDAYTCKCNAGVYENCAKTGTLPGPNTSCSCA